MTITQERLREICTYDPETGVFSGIIDRGRRYKAGDRFGNIDKKGYLQVTIDGRCYHLHRLAWLYVYGRMPENQIDHRNGITGDNRIENLRIATRSEQNYNQRRKDGVTGWKNVFKVKATGNYKVVVRAGGIVRVNKTFNNIEDAILAAKKAREEHHGDFARHE